MYEVDAQMITIKKGADVDIGANPSAEDAEEAGEEGTETVNNIAHSFRLQATQFDKKSFLVYLKVRSASEVTEYLLNFFKKKQGYMKAVKAQLPADRVETFEKGAQAYAKKIVGKFNDYEFVHHYFFTLVSSIFADVHAKLVHRREYEPRRHDCPPQL